MKQGWELKKLGEVLSIERGGSPRPIDKYMTNSPDGINWIKISDATASDKYIYETKEKITKDGLHKTRVVNEGDFILSNSMSFGRPYIMKTTGCIHDGWLVLKQNGKKIFETEFLYYLLSSPFVFQQFNSKAAGSTVRNLNIALVSSVDVPIPPLPEQQSIVAILDETFAAIDQAKVNAEKNLKNVKELFESYLQGVFEKKGEGWEDVRFENLCKLTRGHNPPKSKFISEPKEGYVRFYQIRDGWSDDFAVFVPITTQLHRVEPDEILMVAYRHIGKVFRGVSGAFNVALCKISNKDRKKLDDDFLFYVIPTDKVKGELMKRSERSLIPSMSVEHLKEILIPLPPLKEQKKIVKKLDELSEQTKKLEAIYQQKINDMDELKKSVLQKAFSGELKTSTALV
jgi:type I restriction enzyme S subunit